jgi:hypothetical protein
MRLVKAGTWARQTFEAGSRPQRDTVVTWILDGAVPGRIIAGYPYVDAEGFTLQPSTGPAPAYQDDDLDLLG